MMEEKAEAGQKLYTRMRLWEFPDQYVIEPTDGSNGSSLAVSRVDGSMSLIGGFLLCLVPQSRFSIHALINGYRRFTVCFCVFGFLFL